MFQFDLPALVEVLAIVPPDRFWPVVSAVVLVVLAVTLPCAVVTMSRRRGMRQSDHSHRSAEEP